MAAHYPHQLVKPAKLKPDLREEWILLTGQILLSEGGIAEFRMILLEDFVTAMIVENKQIAES